MTTQPILILGTHLLAEEMADLISDMPGWHVAGFVENLDRERCRPLLGLPVYWIDAVKELAHDHYAICGISTTHRVAFIEQAMAAGFRFPTLVHPAARVSSTTTLDEGVFISAGVQVAAHTKIGKHVFVNRGALIGHHTTIDDYVTIQPGANVAGACHVERCAWISMSAVVLDRKKIGCHSIVGAGAVVTQDVPPHVQVVGIPARVVKENVAGK